MLMLSPSFVFHSTRHTMSYLVIVSRNYGFLSLLTKPHTLISIIHKAAHNSVFLGVILSEFRDFTKVWLKDSLLFVNSSPPSLSFCVVCVGLPRWFCRDILNGVKDLCPLNWIITFRPVHWRGTGLKDVKFSKLNDTNYIHL